MTDTPTPNAGKIALAEIVAGLDNVFPRGPWHHSPMNRPGLAKDGGNVYWGESLSGSNEKGGHILPTFGTTHNFPGHTEANAAHIAKCDPDTILAIDASYRALEEERDRMRTALRSWVNAEIDWRKPDREGGGSPRESAEEAWEDAFIAAQSAIGDAP